MTFGLEVLFFDGELLISAPGDSEDAQWSGAIEVFKFDGGEWSYQYSIRPSVAVEGQNFGRYVERSDDQLLVRSHSSLYVFERRNGRFEESERIDLEITAEHQACCGFIADSSHAMIQEYRENESGDRIGALLIYRRDGNAWSLVQRIEAPTAANIEFGGAVCRPSADELLIGARFVNDSRVTEVVESFVLDEGSWQHNQSIYPPPSEKLRARQRTLACTSEALFAYAPHSQSVLVFTRSESRWLFSDVAEIPGPYGAQPPFSTTGDRLNVVTRVQAESDEGETDLLPAVAFLTSGPEGWTFDSQVVNPYPEETESWSFGFPIAENEDFRAIAAPYGYQGASKVGSVLVQALNPIQTGVVASTGRPERSMSIVVYPNPAHAVLTVEMPGVDPIDVEVQILDVLGRRVLGTRIQGAADRLDVSRLSRGTYLVRGCRSNQFCGSAAFIKQ